MLFNFAFYSLISVIFLILFLKKDNELARGGMVIYMIIAMIWLWSVLVFREPAGDPWRYMLELNIISELSFSELLAYDKVPFGFGLLNWLTALFSKNSIFFFSVVYIFCVIPLYLAFRERFDKVESAVLMMLYLLYPFYLSGLGNVFKQGIASGFMLWGVTCLLDRDNPKTVKGLTLLFSSVLFHSAFWIPILAVVAWFFIFKKRPVSWALWSLGVCMLIAMAGLSESSIDMFLPKDMIDNLGFGTYFDSNFRLNSTFVLSGYASGFRMDFAIFTLVPLIGVLYIRKRVGMAVSDETIKLYCLLSISYFLLCFIPYSDRLAAIPWFLIPYLVYFSVCKSNLKGVGNYLVIITVISYAILMLDYNKEYFQWLPY